MYDGLWVGFYPAIQLTDRSMDNKYCVGNNQPRSLPGHNTQSVTAVGVQSSYQRVYQFIWLYQNQRPNPSELTHHMSGAPRYITLGCTQFCRQLAFKSHTRCPWRMFYFGVRFHFALTLHRIRVYCSCLTPSAGHLRFCQHDRKVHRPVRRLLTKALQPPRPLYVIGQHLGSTGDGEPSR